jgi:hypothetical protein
LYSGRAFGELKMWNDEIVEEVRKSRLEYASKFSHDLALIFKDIQEQERKSDREVVSRSPKKPELAELSTK